MSFRINIFFILSATWILTAALLLGAQYSDENISKIVRDMETLLHKSAQIYRAGDAVKAKTLVSRIYFDVFEGKGLESRIAAKNPNLKTDLEAKFTEIISLIRSNASPSLVEESMARLQTQLSEVAVLFAEVSAEPKTTFINSFLIILREGFEAILILGALIVYLIRSGHADKVGKIYQGAGWAVLASAMTAVVMRRFLGGSAAGETTEGITMLFAAAVLVYVSYWLTSKAESQNWQTFIRNTAERSLSRKNLFALTLTAFLAVYREGAETVLFYQALASGSEGMHPEMIWAGFLSGLAVLAVVFTIFRFCGTHFPVRPFFAVTGFFLYYLAIKFTGNGMAELQAAGLVGATPVAAIPSIHFMGIYPTVQSLLPQGFLIALALFALLHFLKTSRPCRVNA